MKKVQNDTVVIKNGTVFTDSFTFENRNVIISEDKITAVAGASDTPSDSSTAVNYYDASDCYVIPGLLDIHFHGCVGHDFSDASDEGLSEIAKYELKSGITSICPASMTLPFETIINIIKTAVSHKGAEDESDLCGIHLEGPFLSPEKKGAQNPAYLDTPDFKKIQAFLDTSEGMLKLITIAPELENSMDCIKQFSDRIVFSVGHTAADYNTAVAAFKAGANHCTHFFNAMPPFTHRAPGVIGAAADTDNIDVELICDGIHLDPAVIRTTFRLFGDEHAILISDSMMACGMEDGMYELGGLPVIKKGSRATLNDGTIAGSATNLFDCMRNVISFGIAPEKAIKAATYNPARSIHVEDRYGMIKPGHYANILVLNKDFSIKDIFHRGKLLQK